MTEKIQFPIAVHFVHGNIAKWKDVLALPDPVDLAALRGRIHNSPADGWTFQTYLIVRRNWSNVTISDDLRPRCINVLHYDTLKPSSEISKHFIIAIRADRDPAFIADLEVVQNRSCVISPNQHYIIPWTIPGLIPRDPTRGSRVENIAFIGNLRNIAYRFQHKDFSEALAGLGVNFIVETKNWWDYSQFDVVLAVRDGKLMFINSKPANKLIIAWMAGCPAMLGPESAYREIGRDGINYLEVSEPSQVIAYVKMLQDSPERYRQLVASGRGHALAYTEERLANQWSDFLLGDAAKAYRVWSRGVRSHPIFRWARYQWRLMRRRLWGYQYYPGCDEFGRPKKESMVGTVRRTLFSP